MPDHEIFGPAEPDAPAVIGGDYLTEEAAEEELPEPEPPTVVYVPAEPVDDGAVSVHLRLDEDGALVLLAFGSPELLASCLGAQQRWIAVPEDQIDAMRRSCQADGIIRDPIRPDRSEEADSDTSR